MTPRDLAKARVWVVGDAIIDLWIHGRVERISPEAPVPIFVEETTIEKPGGANNVVENLRALGCTVPYVFATKSAVKRRYIANGQQIFRADLEDCSPIDEATENGLLASVPRDIDVLVLSDYAKGTLTPRVCHHLIQWTVMHGILTVVDPKGDDWSKYYGANVFTPNQAEWDAVRSNRSDLAHVLVTQGAKGMIFCEGALAPLHIPAVEREVYDVTGAGDTVVAVLAAALAIGADLETAARWANAAAGVVVSKRGTAICLVVELEEAIK